MKVEVQPIYERGRGVRAKQRAAKVAVYRGTLQVREERVHELGRNTTIASVLSTTDGKNAPVLPALHDASLLYVSGTQLGLRGFELVEDVQYAQTWDVKVV